MKVRIVNRVKDLGQEKLQVIRDFLKFAQENFDFSGKTSQAFLLSLNGKLIAIIGAGAEKKLDEIALKRDVEIVLMSERIGVMSTGSEITGLIKVLADNRMLLDIIRTIAHEWTHEFARQRKIKLQGYNTQSQEDYANTEAGIMARAFEKKYPQYVALLYN